VLTIIDDDATASQNNPIDSAPFFVRQHYMDFLNREPDAGGLSFWTSELEGCLQRVSAGDKARCLDDKQANVSAAFFLSAEFQQTGYLVYCFYRISFPASSARPRGMPRYREFLRDTQTMGQGVVALVGDWERRLEQNKQVFAEEWVRRAEFLALYPESMSAESYVDALYATAGLKPTAQERQEALAEFAEASGARARVIRRVAENQRLKDSEYNAAFVLIQYFGYLRRNPDDAPDRDFAGFDFWLGKLNEFKGNYIDSEMVRSFIVSGEYRSRFVQSEATNQSPAVDAGTDQTITLPETASLHATANDDGLPAGGVLTLSWEKVSGPGNITFENAGATSTRASFDKPGTYVLSLRASDSLLSTSDELTVKVKAANLPPSVEAGAEQFLTLPETARLAGAVSDDGSPEGSVLTLVWSKVSGPGNVVFGNFRDAQTTAAFGEAGVYVLQLTASDGQLSAHDEVSVTVRPANQSPKVAAGSDQTIELPGTASLSGLVTDDNLPQGSTLQINWSKVSGPGAVAFGNASALSTVASSRYCRRINRRR
jgi:hypothetical protein